MAVDLPLAKQQCRVLHSDEDALIQHYLDAAIAWVERYTGKSLTRTEITQIETAFGRYITLNVGPNPQVASIAYTDSDGTPQTITDASLVGMRLYRPAGWPTVAENTPIVVTYTAGFDTTPADLDAAVLLLVGQWYKVREAVNVGNIVSEIPFGVEALCLPYRAVLV